MKPEIFPRLSQADLSLLSDELARRNWAVLHSGQHDDGIWRASFEHLWNSDAGPERAIAAMLEVIEGLAEPLNSVWAGCRKREFNIGIQAEREPHAFEAALSNALLSRLAAVGASMSVTSTLANDPRAPR